MYWPTCGPVPLKAVWKTKLVFLNASSWIGSLDRTLMSDNFHSFLVQNSIRHNLSLHSRFMRIQNEGTGKSSWWMLNPEGGKSGKSPRRRAASMDNNSKLAKSRGRASKKKVQFIYNVYIITLLLKCIIPFSLWGLSCFSVSRWLYKKVLKEELAALVPSTQTGWGAQTPTATRTFEPWSSFRTRTSSDASTLSGHHSPFPPEQDDLGESDGHMIYSGAVGPKMTSTLPSLSEVAGTLGQHDSEIVMESLLDNLQLLSPKIPTLGSDSSHSSNAAMLQSSPYSSSGLTQHSQQDYRKCMYGPGGMNSFSSTPMRTLPETKPGFGAYENQYICNAGLLKDLLTSDADASRDMMASRDTLVSQVEMGGCLMATYSSQSHVGRHSGVKMMNLPQRHPVPRVNPQAIHNQGPSTSRDLNSCNMIPLTTLTSPSGAPPQMTNLRTCMQMPRGTPSTRPQCLSEL